MLDALHKKPLITADLHLGEGTGAVASLPLWDMALAVYNHCYSFTEGGIAPYTRNADAVHRRCGQPAKVLLPGVSLPRAPAPRTYLATMQVWDAECAARVAKHRAMRAEKQFNTVECPLHLDRLTLPRRGTVLLEDLGNLAANELYDPDGAGENAAAAILRGIENIAQQCENLILVSNEVFAAGPITRAIPTAICARWPPSTTRRLPAPTPWCGSCAGYRSIIKEAKDDDSFADHRRGVCHVFRPADAAIRLERKKYAVRALRFPAGGGCVRGAVVPVRYAAAAALARAAGFCLVPVWVTGGIHLDGYADTCDALSSYGDTAKKLEILKDPHCGAFAVIRLCSYFAAYFALCGCVQFTPRVGALWALALVGERAAVGLGCGGVPAGEKHRALPTPLPQRQTG